MSDVSGYLVGRDPGQWPSGTSQAEDVVFAAVRKDGSRLEGMEFRHCTFANVSFKEATLEKCRFTDCVFLDCYFRRTKLSETAFIGCKFVGCDFPRVTIQSCDFKYSRFEGCALPFGELEHSLPREPNLREELTRGLAIASDILGLGNEARHYRLEAIHAREEHLRSAVFGRSDWYQLHYPGLKRLEALLQWVASRANGVIWGHGEKWMVLVFNILLLALVIFPGLLWLVRDGLVQAAGDPLSFRDLVWLSVTTLIPVDGIYSVSATTWSGRSILASEALAGIVAAGLLITLLVRRMVKT